MNYDAAVRYLLSLGRELAAPTQAAAAKFDLENITVLSERLGRPDRAYPSVHIAGTNGKGSTAAFLESILRHAGFRTGLNTSPHLEKINERIRVNSAEINDSDFAQTLTRIQSLIEELLAAGKLRAHPTYFECVTAMAFQYFAQARVEFGVFEVGLGGRLDATNILTPAITVISRIDFDHENFLGHSLREIAAEKAGILKKGVPAVLAAQRPEAREIILARVKELSCPVIETPLAYRVDQQTMENGCVRARITEIASGWSTRLAPQLAGRFQLQNAISAVAAARTLSARGYRIPESAIEQGIAGAIWPRDAWKNCNRTRTSTSMARTIPARRASWRRSGKKTSRAARFSFFTERCATKPSMKSPVYFSHTLRKLSSPSRAPRAPSLLPSSVS